MTDRLPDRTLLVSFIEAAACALVGAACAAMWIYQGLRRRERRHVEPVPVVTAEPEPTTVDELVNSARVDGPVTLIIFEDDGDEGRVWN